MRHCNKNNIGILWPEGWDRVVVRFSTPVPTSSASTFHPPFFLCRESGASHWEHNKFGKKHPPKLCRIICSKNSCELLWFSGFTTLNNFFRCLFPLCGTKAKISPSSARRRDLFAKLENVPLKGAKYWHWIRRRFYDFHHIQDLKICRIQLFYGKEVPQWHTHIYWWYAPVNFTYSLTHICAL